MKGVGLFLGGGGSREWGVGGKKGGGMGNWGAPWWWGVVKRGEAPLKDGN